MCILNFLQSYQRTLICARHLKCDILAQMEEQNSIIRIEYGSQNSKQKIAFKLVICAFKISFSFRSYKIRGYFTPKSRKIPITG